MPFEDAIGMYHVDISTLNPFPSQLKDHKSAFSKFTRACSEGKVSMDFKEDHLKVVHFHINPYDHKFDGPVIDYIMHHPNSWPHQNGCKTSC
jgi:hypothetical protein